MGDFYFRNTIKIKQSLNKPKSLCLKFNIMNEILKLLIFSFSSVLFLFLISKLMGKKQIAQLEFIDYVMGISIGSIAAEMATDINDTPFYYYLIGMTVFFLFDMLVSFLGRKGPAMKHFFKGCPETIIYYGKIQYKALKKSKLDINEVLSMCREKGYFDINDVAFAVFETSGNLSVMPKGNKRIVEISDISKDISEASLPYYLIVDGHISYSTLTELNKDIDWLYNKANLNKKLVKKVLFAEYFVDTDTIDIQYKK